MLGAPWKKYPQHFYLNKYINEIEDWDGIGLKSVVFDCIYSNDHLVRTVRTQKIGEMINKLSMLAGQLNKWSD